MKTITNRLLTILGAQLNLRLAAYAMAAAAIAGTTATVQAAIVYADPADISIPDSLTNGIYLNFVTGVVTRQGDVDGDLFAGGINGSIVFAAPANQGAGAVCDPAITAYRSVLALAAGTAIGPSSYLRNGELSAPNYYVDGTEYLGLSFLNEVTGAIDYGWARISTTAPNANASTRGLPASILDYAYENTGAPILAGAVPEPATTTAILGLGALPLGAAGLRRWRRRGSSQAGPRLLCGLSTLRCPSCTPR